MSDHLWLILGRGDAVPTVGGSAVPCRDEICSAKRVSSRRNASFTHAGGAVALLGDDRSRPTPCASVGGCTLVGVHLRADSMSDDHVGVLLEGAGLAQVRQQGPVVRPRLGRAAQLRQQRSIGHVAAPSPDPSSAARDRTGKFQRAVLKLPAAAASAARSPRSTMLQPVLRTLLEATALRAHLEHAQRRRYRR